MSDTPVDTPATASPQVVKPAEKMLKHDLHKHLRNFHHTYGEGTKADLRVQHEVAHDAAKFHDMGISAFPDDYHVEWARGRRTFPMVINHIHGDEALSNEPLTPEQEKALSSAKAGEPISDTPLNASERTVLKQLVDNDFSRTATQVKQMAAHALMVREAAIQAAWQAKIDAAQEYKAKVKAIQVQAREAYTKLVEDAAADGIELGGDRYSRQDAFRVYDNAFKTNVTGLATELQKAKNENQALLNKALLDLEEQRLIVQARILRSALTEKTAKILDTLPTAEQVMLEAQVQAGKALSSGDPIVTQ